MKKSIWKKRNPKGGHHKTMNRVQRARARRSARRQGRENPSLVDNINAMRDR